MKKLCALAAAVFVAEAGTGLAQEQQSFKTIMGKGYEIKNVTFARGEATENREIFLVTLQKDCLLYTSPSPRDGLLSRMPSSA